MFQLLDLESGGCWEFSRVLALEHRNWGFVWLIIVRIRIIFYG